MQRETTMPIYGLRRDRLLDDDPQWERLMQKAVSATREPQPVHDTTPQPVQDVADLRKANPVDYLLPASNRWLKSLPPEVQPLALATEYPRIVNLLAQHWDDREACVAFFSHLLLDHRGKRQGFPVAVKSDIRMLQEYFLLAAPLGIYRSNIGK
jgi:hypothetical protein